MGDTKNNEVVVGAETNIPTDHQKFLPAPTETTAAATKQSDGNPSSDVVRARCEKCKRTFIKDTMNILDERFENAELCDPCFDNFSKVVNGIRTTNYKKWVDKQQKKEPKIFKKFLKGKYDEKDTFAGCFVYFAAIIGFLITLIALGIWAEKSNNKYTPVKYKQKEVVLESDSSLLETPKNRSNNDAIYESGQPETGAYTEPIKFGTESTSY